MSKTEKEQAADVIEALSGFVAALMRGGPTQVVPPKIEFRDMKAELAGAAKSQPVSHTDEFEAAAPNEAGGVYANALDVAEDMAKLRRELAEEQGRSACHMQTIETMGAEFERMKARRYEAAKKADEYLRERNEARVAFTEVQSMSCGYASTINAVWDALGDNRPPGLIEEVVAAQRRELLELRERDAAAQTAEANWQEVARERDEARAGLEEAVAQAESLKEEQEAIHTALGFVVLPQGGLPAAAARLVAQRNALLEQAEAFKKKTQAFPWAEMDDLRGEVLDYRRRLGAVESALDAEAVVQDYTERVLENHKTHILDLERTLGTIDVAIGTPDDMSTAQMVMRRMRELRALSDWQTSISAALECSPANAHDRVGRLWTKIEELRAQHKSGSVAGDE